MAAKLNIILGPETRQTLEALADRNKESMADVVRRLIHREGRLEGVEASRPKERT
jgi:hypothetical protein